MLNRLDPSLFPHTHLTCLCVKLRYVLSVAVLLVLKIGPVLLRWLVSVCRHACVQWWRQISRLSKKSRCYRYKTMT